MPCCGNQRARLPGPTRSNHTFAPAENSREQPRRILRDRVVFKYLGQTGMTVIGPITGKRYRFDGPGSMVEVDLRDRLSLAALPRLRQMQ